MQTLSKLDGKKKLQRKNKNEFLIELNLNALVSSNDSTIYRTEKNTGQSGRKKNRLMEPIRLSMTLNKERQIILEFQSEVKTFREKIENSLSSYVAHSRLDS